MTMSAQDRSQPTMTTTPLQHVIFVAAVVLSLLPAAALRRLRLLHLALQTATQSLHQTSTTKCMGHSNAVSDGSTESEYYPSTTGGIVFRAASVSTVFQYQTYSTTVGPMVGAAVQHMHALDSVGGYYHRTISGPGAALDALWSDVLPGGIPIVPTAGLVFTVDNSYLYPYDTTSVISTQTIVLWNSVSSLMLFRIKSITYPTGIINYGGYLGPTASYKIALGSRSHNLSRHRCRCRTPSCRV